MKLVINTGTAMKMTTLFLLSLSLFKIAEARDLEVVENPFYQKIQVEYKTQALEKDAEVQNLNKTIAFMQRNYEEKINHLEIELAKTKTRLIEKSLNEESLQSSIKEQYDHELFALKKELAVRTRSLMESQRQIEKMNPSEDMKKMILANTDLTAELRKKEGHLAVVELEMRKTRQVNTNIKVYDSSKTRMPASVSGSK